MTQTTSHGRKSTRSGVPALRIRPENAAVVRRDGEFVLYWMTAFRRTTWNFSLDRALEWAQNLGKPLLIFEPLRVGYLWASERLHAFILDGMADNAARVARLNRPGLAFYPYVEPAAAAGRGLLESLAGRSCVVVTDLFPSFFLPRMLATAANRLSVRLEAVDSNGLLPLAATEQVFSTAFAFRRYLQRQLPEHLTVMPLADPLPRARLPDWAGVPTEILERWPPATAALLSRPHAGLGELPVDHAVRSVDTPGGATAASARLAEFLKRTLPTYPQKANQPDEDARSRLSPYLHFGHLSVHEVFSRLMQHEGWSAERISAKTSGSRTGWWNVSAGAEAWLDELVTWRELGYNMAFHCDDYDQYESLPVWARATLEKHAADRRAFTYTVEQFAAADTHDSVWNAAQTQLLTEGRIHNYLRMLWGKKILEWSATPREALAVMIELNNRYALDGRNPNSYSGIFWCLGRYDRAWGPERPIYGTVRYMSSDNTIRKLHVREYLERYRGQGK